jgi:hypothetical protein
MNMITISMESCEDGGRMSHYFLLGHADNFSDLQ